MSVAMDAAIPPAPSPAESLLAALWPTVPLEVLLAATNAEVREVDPALVADDAADWWFGFGAELKGGRVALVMPAGQPPVERDTIARDLLARMRRVALPGQTPARAA